MVFNTAPAQRTTSAKYIVLLRERLKEFFEKYFLYFASRDLQSCLSGAFNGGFPLGHTLER
jgi:hypothetical protein